MPTHVISGSSGLVTNTASLSVPGGLRIARDVVIRRPVHQGIDFGFIQSGGGLIEPRRSYEQFSQFTFPLADSPITGMFEYDNLNATLGAAFYLVGATGKIYRADSPTLLTQMGTEALGLVPNTTMWTTSQAQTTSATNYVRSAQMNGNVYFCTKYGVYVFDQVSNAVRPRQAGIGRALDISQLVSGSGVGNWMLNNSSVAYRVVWGYRDPSQNPVYLGPPSGRATFFNTSGFTENTQLTFPPPNSIVNDIANSGGRTYFYQVYRTAASTAGTGLTSIPDPGDAMTLIYQGTATTSAPVVFIDITPDGFIKGPDLYTNANMEGIQNANYPPPACADIAAFKGVMFYANCAGTTRNSVTRIGTVTSMGTITSMTGGGVGPSLITINVGGVAFANPNNEGLVTTNRFTVGGFSVMGLTATGYPVSVSIAGNNGAAVNGDFFIHAVTASTIVYVAQTNTTVGTGGTYLLEGFGINGGDMVISASRNFTINSGAGGFNAVASPATYLNTSPGTPAQNIAIVTQEMAAAFSYLLPRTFTYPPVYVSILGGPTDAPGQIGVEASNPGPLVANSATTTASMTTILCTKSLGSKMIYPDSSVAVVPQQDVSPARLMYSKTFQPEAVSLTSFFDVGDKGAPIRRIIATRDNLFIFKDDGVYRLSDDPNVGGKPVLYDPTLILVNPNLACTIDNSIYMLSTRGFFKLSNTGAAEFGLQIRDVAVMLIEAQNTGLPNICIGNERDQLIHWTIPGPNNSVWSLCYSIITQTWTQGNVTDPAPLIWPGLYYRGTLVSSLRSLHSGVVLRHSNRDVSGTGTQVTAGDIFQESVIDQNDNSLVTNLSANTASQLALNCLPPPGDRYYAKVATSVGSVITLTELNASGVSPAVGDAIWQIGAGTQYWTVTGVSGPNITVSPYSGSGLAPTTTGTTTFNATAGACYLMKPLMIDVEWSGFNGGNDAAMKHWKGAAVFFDELCSATDTFNVYSYTEIDQVSQTAAWPSPGVVVHPIYSARIILPMRHQRSRRLHLGFTGGQALKFTVISGFGVESKEHSDTRETE